MIYWKTHTASAIPAPETRDDPNTDDCPRNPDAHVAAVASHYSVRPAIRKFVGGQEQTPYPICRPCRILRKRRGVPVCPQHAVAYRHKLYPRHRCRYGHTVVNRACGRLFYRRLPRTATRLQFGHKQSDTRRGNRGNRIPCRCELAPSVPCLSSAGSVARALTLAAQPPCRR